MPKFKSDILSNFQTMCLGIKKAFKLDDKGWPPFSHLCILDCSWENPRFVTTGTRKEFVFRVDLVFLDMLILNLLCMTRIYYFTSWSTTTVLKAAELLQFPRLGMRHTYSTAARERRRRYKLSSTSFRNYLLFLKTWGMAITLLAVGSCWANFANSI